MRALHFQALGTRRPPRSNLPSPRFARRKLPFGSRACSRLRLARPLPRNPPIGGIHASAASHWSTSNAAANQSGARSSVRPAATCRRIPAAMAPPRATARFPEPMTASASPREPQGVAGRLESDPLLLAPRSEYDKALELTVGEVRVPDAELGERFSWRTLWAYAGPGWLMSIAYVDPGNLESDLQAGAYAGFQLIWVLFAATVMGFFLQVLAARLGVVTGKNLAEMCTDKYPRWASLVLWVMTEIAIVGSDIQEVLGSAIAFQILFNFPLYVGCLITGVDAFTFLLLHRYGIRKLEAFFVSLIAVMLVCFCINFFRGGVATTDVVSGFMPRVQSYAVVQAVGIVGAVIMPHNIFLHSALVQTRQVDPGNARKVHEANKYFAIESGGALFVSFLINLAVLGVFAKGFFSTDCTGTFAEHGINTACVPGGVADGDSYGSCQLSNGVSGECQGIGLSQAGVALSGMLGEYAETIWAVGLLAAGQSSTMTGTYAGQFVMEGFLNLHLSPWKRVAVTRCMSLVPALVVALLSEANPQDSDRMDEFLNILQSIQLPFALLPVLMFTSSRHVMGRFVNNTATIVTGWIFGAIVCLINLYLIFVNVKDMQLGVIGTSALIVAGGGYFWFLGYLMKAELRSLLHWAHSLWHGEPVFDLS